MSKELEALFDKLIDKGMVATYTEVSEDGNLETREVEVMIDETLQETADE